MPGTEGADYTQRLADLEGAPWKRLLDVQRPYRWNVRRVTTGRVLDVGCGIGRNLAHLGPGAVGVDHNPESVALARARGLEAYTDAEFVAGPLARPDTFDTLLVAHVLEHLPQEAGDELLRTYAAFVRRPGRIVLICPQERGYASDATHVRWVDDQSLDRHLQRLGATGAGPVRSFPLPRAAGRWFTYNEFVAVATLP